MSKVLRERNKILKKKEEEKEKLTKTHYQENKPLHLVLGTLDIQNTVSKRTPASPSAPEKSQVIFIFAPFIRHGAKCLVLYLAVS